jgi:hypothetical protein
VIATPVGLVPRKENYSGKKGRITLPGLAEMCVSGHHAACSDVGCRCLCHPWAQELVKKSSQVSHSSGTSLSSKSICPKCNKIPKDGDIWCRDCGSRILHGISCECGRVADATDKFCYWCGQSLTTPAVPIPELSEDEITALEARARTRPSDVEVPPTEIH